MAEAVVDASALVDLLLANDLGVAVTARIAGHGLHAPAHVDAEVFSAVGRLHRAGAVEDLEVDAILERLAAAPIKRHPVADLLTGSWARRHQLRLADALYFELATSLALPLVTTDRRLHPVPGADVIAA